jgi:hypothetical protein
MAWGQDGVVKAAEGEDDEAYMDATAEIPDAEIALILTKHGRNPQFDALAADDKVYEAATDDAEGEVRQPRAKPALDFANGIPPAGGALPARVPLGPGEMRVPYDTKAPPQTRYACPGDHRSFERCQCDEVQWSRREPIREVRSPPRFECVPECPWHGRNVLLCSITRDRERRLSCVQGGSMTVNVPADETPHIQPQAQQNVLPHAQPLVFNNTASRVAFAGNLTKMDLKYVARLIQKAAGGPALDSNTSKTAWLAEVTRILNMHNAAANDAFDAAAKTVSSAHTRLSALPVVRAQPQRAGYTNQDGPSHGRQGQERDRAQRYD